VFALDRVFWIYFVIVSLGSTTFATTVYFISVHNLGSKKASVFTFLVPFFALGSSILFLNETLQWTTFLGVLMTIFALIVLNNIKLDLGQCPYFQTILHIIAHTPPAMPRSIHSPNHYTTKGKAD
jgi:drug/metabolite transporter (DMT)-like permease